MRPRRAAALLLGGLSSQFGGVRPTAACRWAVYAGERPELASSLFLSEYGGATHALDTQVNREPVGDLATHHLTADPTTIPLPYFLGDAPDGLFFDPKKFFLRNHPSNTDGWGLGWYSGGDLNQGLNPRTRTITGPVAKRYRDPEPGVIQTVTRDDYYDTTTYANVTAPDLVALTQIVKSPIIFGHIRAATKGAPLVVHRRANAHPFLFNGIMWMHNGGLPSHAQDALRNNILCEDLKGLLVSGSTDSEYLGAYFVSQLISVDPLRDQSVQDFCSTRSSATFVPTTTTPSPTTTTTVSSTSSEGGAPEGDAGGTPDTETGSSSQDAVVEALSKEGANKKDNSFYSTEAMVTALKNTVKMVTDLGGEPSSLNIAVSDGNVVLALRYRTSPAEDPPSLYYARTQKSVWISSEPLDAGREEPVNWNTPADKRIPPQILFDHDAESNFTATAVAESSLYTPEYGTESRTWYSLNKDELLVYEKNTDTLTFECLTSACEQDKKERRKRRKKRATAGSWFASIKSVFGSEDNDL
ncbi:unnamed protein product [Amoebophrya sp. A25]|nr:unnamed protein product [Amoebophrya sp. A25]|eukprot:GSA25T00009258001.1